MKGAFITQLCSTFYTSLIFVVYIVSMSNFSCRSEEERIFITMVTHNPQSSDIRRAHYYCFVNSSELDVTVSTGRVLETRGNYRFTNTNPNPSNPVLQRSASYPSGSSVYEVNLNFGGDYEFGTYSCDASWDDNDDGVADHTVSVSNIILRSDGTIYPANRLVTQTVNVGDRDVRIEMYVEPTIYESYLEWRHDRSVLRGTDSSTGTVSFSGAIQKRDEGVYIYYFNYLWQSALHGMQRLIVRDCPSKRWGPPHCHGICDNCYNGGVCDDQTGRCICPPGFKGANCLTACGSNRFGYNCEFTCFANGGDNACLYRQFCLPDPYGCTCNTGMLGLNCNSLCIGGKFGASCLQNCHCRQTCDRFTGECPRTDCEQGFSGQSCQIPDLCPDDYYGSECVQKCHCKDDAPCDKVTGQCSNQECSLGYTVYPGSVTCQECLGGYFGDGCQQECHCEASACDRVTGECSGLCKSQWTIDSNCQAGLVSAEGAIVNPNTAALVRCTAEGTQYQLNSRYRLYLSREQDRLDVRNIRISAITPSTQGRIQRKTTTFQIDDVTVEKQFFCQLTISPFYGTTVYAFLPVTVSVYNLPELTHLPEKINVNSSAITIRWDAWDRDRDIGDEPVLAYIPYYKRNSSEEWINGSILHKNDTLEFRATDLETDTSYMFAVAAVREGVGGGGPRGPSLIVKTLCDAEPSTAVEVAASLTTNNQIRVTWQVTGEIMCSTGITNFSVYYVTEGSSQKPKFVTMVTADQMETFVESSPRGNGSHTFYVTFTTDAESILIVKEDKYSNATVYLKTKVEDPDSTSNKISGIPSLVSFMAPVLVLVLLCLIVGVLILVRIKKKQRKSPIQDIYEDPPDNKKEVPNSNLSGEYEGVESKLDPSETVMVDIRNQTASLKRDTTLEEYQDVEDSEDEDAEHIYGNLQPPEPIKVAMFEDYVTRNAANLEQEFEILKKGKIHPWTIAASESNKKKNRFKNMLTYDHSRVVLSTIPGDPSSDYYNASYIQNQKGENAFIASQGPNTASLADFWRMVWEQNVSTIVMITNLYEGGKDRCSQYWPKEEGSCKPFGDLEITWSKTSTFSDFVIRKLTLHHMKEKDGNPHHIQQFHFLTWPDMSVPKEVTPVLNFTKQVKLASNEKSTPTLVHCSAGIGRTGTFIALYSLIDVLTNERVISIFDFVEKMRENRINMVQTSKQYLFLYKCLLEFHQTRHTEIPAGLLERFDFKSKRSILLKEHKLLAEIGEVILKVKKNQDGLREDNKLRNRFPDKVPYDGSRPFLVSWGSGDNKEGYINATILKSFTKQDAFISTQSPLPNTIEDFWKMVFDWNCSLIVMLNQLDPTDETCQQYWSEQDSAEFGSMTVTCVVEEDESIFTRRVFEISHVHSEGIKSVHHLQLHSWPPEGNLSAVLGLIQEVEKLKHHLSIISPIAVHCIDGVGRSGVFVTVMSELERIDRNHTIDVFSTVRQLRQSHPDVLSREEDYLLCYQLLKAHLVNACEYQNI